MKNMCDISILPVLLVIADKHLTHLWDQIIANRKPLHTGKFPTKNTTSDTDRSKQKVITSD